MKFPFRFTALLLAGLTGTVAAADQAPSLEKLGNSFRHALTEEETRLLLEYMRDSLLAAFNNQEVSLPPDLAFKLEVLQQRLKQEGNFYLDNFLRQLEQDIIRSLKEKPAQPYTPPPSLSIELPAVMTPSAPSTTPATPPPPTNFNPPPWGYAPWFYLPKPAYPSVPAPAPMETYPAK